jgi:hypothetical protein
MVFESVEIPPDLENCRNVWLYRESGQWILSTRSKIVAKFETETEAFAWWRNFEASRGFPARAPKRVQPPAARRRAHNSQQPVTAPTTQTRSFFRATSPEFRQALLAKINQGRCDSEPTLLSLMKRADERGEEKILNAVRQRLKIVAPNTYRKLVGPLHVRDPLGNKKCYCGRPVSLKQIARDIITDSISEESLLCDACWEQDICLAWGYYGAWGAKIISTQTWTIICERRGDTKYATY